MTTETMTVTAALVELKTLGSRIDRAINEASYVNVFNPKAAPVSKEDMEKRITSGYASVRDLITRRNAIKRAVIDSNANTVVENLPNLPPKGDGTTGYTVAEIIDMRKNGVESLISLRDKMTRAASAAMQLFERTSQEVEKTAQDLRCAVTGNTPTQSLSEEDRAASLYAADAYVQRHKPTLVDPLNIMDIIGTLQREIETIKDSTDVALSICNAKTVITVSYGAADTNSQQ